MVYPISSMGSHVSAIPNHQLLRNTPIETRANVAYFGTFGYELDLNKLSVEEQKKVKEQKTAVVGYYRVLQRVNSSYTRLKLQGLSKDFLYHDSVNGTDIFGDELMQSGLITSDASSGENKETYNGSNGDYQSRLYILTAK